MNYFIKNISVVISDRSKYCQKWFIKNMDSVHTVQFKTAPKFSIAISHAFQGGINGILLSENAVLFSFANHHCCHPAVSACSRSSHILPSTNMLKDNF